MIYSFNDQWRGILTGNFCTHFFKASNKISHLRLLSSIVNCRNAFSKRRRHDDILCGGNWNQIKINLSTYKLFRLSINVSILNLNGCAHLLKSVQMQVDRSGSNSAATREWYFSFFVLCEHWTKRQNRGAHRFNESIFSYQISKLWWVNKYRSIFLQNKVWPNIHKQPQSCWNVTQLRGVG